VATALAAGIWSEEFWFTQALILVAMGQGMVAGAAWRRFWREDARTEIFGAGGRYAGFLAAVAFSAVEAYAVGKGFSRGAPGLAALLLAPPIVVGAVALRSARRVLEERAAGDGAGGEEPAVPGSGPRGAPGDETTTRTEDEGRVE
jgi:hypothetical protein